MLVEEMLRPIPNGMLLEECNQSWITGILEAVNKAITEQNIDTECLTTTSTGKELRDALRSLPAAVQITILNDTVVSSRKRRRRMSDKEKDQQIQMDIMERKMKLGLMMHAAYFAAGLVTLVILAMIGMVIFNGDNVDTDIVSTLITSTVDILKLIFSK